MHHLYGFPDKQEHTPAFVDTRIEVKIGEKAALKDYVRHITTETTCTAVVCATSVTRKSEKRAGVITALTRNCQKNHGVGVFGISYTPYAKAQALVEHAEHTWSDKRRIAQMRPSQRGKPLNQRGNYKKTRHRHQYQ
jgi:hypothetical protein